MIRIFFRSLPSESAADSAGLKRFFLSADQLIDSLVDIEEGDLLLAAPSPSFAEARKLADDISHLYQSVFATVDVSPGNEEHPVVFILRSLSDTDMDLLTTLANGAEFAMLSRLVRLASGDGDLQKLCVLARGLSDRQISWRLTSLLVKELTKKGMSLEQYQREVHSVDYPDKGQSPYYPLLGFGEEIGELLEKIEEDTGLEKPMTEKEKLDIIKEVGDIIWYCLNFCNETGLDFEGIRQLAESEKREWDADCQNILFKRVLRLDGLIGKAARDDGGAITSARRARLHAPLVEIVSCLSALSRRLGKTLEEVALINKEKLADRRRRNVVHGSGDDR